jgi:hypothetical protein
MPVRDFGFYGFPSCRNPIFRPRRAAANSRPAPWEVFAERRGDDGRGLALLMARPSGGYTLSELGSLLGFLMPPSPNPNSASPILSLPANFIIGSEPPSNLRRDPSGLPPKILREIVRTFF